MEYFGNNWALEMNYHAQKSKTEIEIEPLIVGDFSDFNRIFYLEGNMHIEESLLLFSKAQQKFKQVIPKKHAFPMECEVNSNGVYEEVEIFDQKLFCIQKSPLVLDVFFSSKKKRFFHKRSFHFKDKNLELGEQIRLLIWKYDKADIGYRCLLGPLRDRRFMHFSLGKKSFGNQEPKEQSIDRVFLVSLALDSDKESPPNIVVALKPDKNTFLCFDEEKKYFFEYGEFAGTDSMKLEILKCDKFQTKNLNRMYLHYPYDNYTMSTKKRIKRELSSICSPNIDIDKFARNRYKEILLCMEDGSLYTMCLANRNYSFDDKELQWEIHTTTIGNNILPVDITIDKTSGRIFTFFHNLIYCLKSKETEETIAERVRTERKNSLLKVHWDS